MVLASLLIVVKCCSQIFLLWRKMMKKFISALILTALLLSSILAIVPASAAEATDRESILVNSKSDQFAGKGPAFYYDYHLYEHEVGEYPSTNWVRRENLLICSVHLTPQVEVHPL
jgi:hypothetical protein